MDDTVAIAKNYADVVASKGPERSAQRNHGANLARGEYFLFIDSDMNLAPQVLAHCVEEARNSAAPAVVVPELSLGEGFLARCRALERSCYEGDDSVEAARFFSREAFERSGGFDERLTGPEDWDLSIRIARGRHLPRTASRISHDEGKLRLGAIMAKKRYYAASSIQYLRKHGRTAYGQGNLVVRPAFVRNWRRLLSHPVLTAGIFFMKAMETVATIWGVLETWSSQRRIHGSRSS
jgi:cellulose synthase/poly-beta-1,6-N-acetylglucosamine synthase-like glycosyltransferase